MEFALLTGLKLSKNVILYFAEFVYLHSFQYNKIYGLLYDKADSIMSNGALCTTLYNAHELELKMSCICSKFKLTVKYSTNHGGHIKWKRWQNVGRFALTREHRTN